jgi:hypothetical protein
LFPSFHINQGGRNTGMRMGSKVYWAVFIEFQHEGSWRKLGQPRTLRHHSSLLQSSVEVFGCQSHRSNGSLARMKDFS